MPDNHHMKFNEATGDVIFYYRENNVELNVNYYIDNIEILTFIVAIICSMPIFRNIVLPITNKYKNIAVNTWIIALFVLSASAIAASTYNPFILLIL